MPQIPFTSEMSTQLSSSPSHVDFLLLGAGWLSQFLLPLLLSHNISHLATTRSGEPHYPTDSPLLPFAYDQKAGVKEVTELFLSLPTAKTVLVTFPITEVGASKVLVEGYLAAKKERRKKRVDGGEVEEANEGEEETVFVRLGSTGVWSTDNLAPGASSIFTRHSPIPPSNARGVSEDEFLLLPNEIPHIKTVVFNLAGLWGGERRTKNWVEKIAPNKETLAKKGSLHMIHGLDISHSLINLHSNSSLLPPRNSSSPTSTHRYLLTDTRLYDWWDLASSWGQSGQAQWVRELMQEDKDLVSLPRSRDQLGRVLDSREFWEVFGGGRGFERLE